MRIFRSRSSYYQFEGAVQRQSRYFFDSDTEDFLNTVLETARTRVEKLKAGSILWRSQLGYDWESYYEGDKLIGEQPVPYKSERMKPLKYLASEGRANPKGIPYLYLSTDKNTAMAEVRPWIGSYISLAQFKLLKDVKLVNCTTDYDEETLYQALLYSEGEELEPEDRENAVWLDIDRAFSQPLTPSDDFADYIPTQIIAELFKNNGFDGIAYRSSLGRGHNIALFDLEVADLVNCTLFSVRKISFGFSKLL